MNPADLRDIRGPVPIPPPWLYPAIALGVIAVAWLAFVLVRRWWKARKALLPTGPSPEEVALARLAAARRLIDPPRPHEFGVAISEAVRLYVEDRFGERAGRRTTEELLRDLAARPASPLAPQRDLLADFLTHCDLAKFARQPLGQSDMETMHQSASRFVAAVRPHHEFTPESPAAALPASAVASTATDR